jgi:hypothetical protein
MKGDKGIYFHGTWIGYGHSIMSRGFELGHEGLGHYLGRGVYIAPELASAALWAVSDFIIICSLKPGTRILWIDGTHDERVIDRLRREFGKQLLELGPHFQRAIPHNKQLTQSELIELCNYVLMRRRYKHDQYWRRARKGKTATYFDSWMRLGRLHQYVRRYGYDALGDRSHSAWDSDEILVYNPASVVALSAHWLLRSGEDLDERLGLSKAIPLSELEEISAAAQEEEE